MKNLFIATFLLTSISFVSFGQEMRKPLSNKTTTPVGEKVQPVKQTPQLRKQKSTITKTSVKIEAIRKN
jgi:hypothetical protein